MDSKYLFKITSVDRGVIATSKKKLQLLGIHRHARVTIVYEYVHVTSRLINCVTKKSNSS